MLSKRVVTRVLVSGDGAPDDDDDEHEHDEVDEIQVIELEEGELEFRRGQRRRARRERRGVGDQYMETYERHGILDKSDERVYASQ